MTLVPICDADLCVNDAKWAVTASHSSTGVVSRSFRFCDACKASAVKIGASLGLLVDYDPLPAPSDPDADQPRGRC